MVDDDRMIQRLATEALKTHSQDYAVVTASNGNDAAQILGERKIDLVLTDLKMPGMDGYELLSYMSRNHRNIPTIVMTGFGSPDIAKQLKMKGVLHYIEKPFEINVLRQTISEIFAREAKGFIHGFTLPSFLQACELEQKSTTLKIESGNRVGYLFLEDGELIDAGTANREGEDAALAILCWNDARIEIQSYKPDHRRTIHTPLMNILLCASKKKDDESEQAEKENDELDHAVLMAEGHHFKEAKDILTDMLRENPRNPRAWFWYSRIIVTCSTIETALKNAKKLDPGSPVIDDEIRKLTIWKQKGKDAPLRRCPFCWSPIHARAYICHFCLCHLFIHKDFFLMEHSGKKTILDAAIERYMNVISRETNVNACFYMGMSYLNLEQWDEAMNLLNKTVSLAPGRKVFSDQLRILVNFVAQDKDACKTKDDYVIPPVQKTKDKNQAKKTILVVEDSSTTRKVISITLARKGYEIIEARDGLEALSMLSELRPDLILLDIVLPKMDGYKILEIIKKNADFKNIPVIMLTSKDGMMSKLKGRLSGSAAYLTKPFEPVRLVETIEKYLSKNSPETG